MDPLWPLSLFHLITFLSAVTLNPPTPRVLHVSPCVAAFSSWYLEPTLPQYKPVTHLVQSSPTATSQVDSRSWIQFQLHPPHMHLLLLSPKQTPPTTLCPSPSPVSCVQVKGNVPPPSSSPLSQTHFCFYPICVPSHLLSKSPECISFSTALGSVLAQSDASTHFYVCICFMYR